MNKEEQKIENLLKQEMQKVSPSHAFFDVVLESVTKEKANRNTIQGEHYNFINIFSMKKFLTVGIPVAALALLAIVTINKPKDDDMLVRDGNESMEENVDSSVTKDDSVDTIIDNMFVDYNTEVALASAEAEEESDLYAEIEAFNSLTTTEYENNI
ncbi:MAG: hypothetical protein QG551_451 [Patescibacteria group bacterium]|jgi:hypothetical protein|nr:hypothetical protein [Patescibacteria group bacterium]